MFHAWSPLAVLLTSTGLLLAGNSAQAAGYHEVDLRALEIQSQAENLEHQFAHEFRFSPHYRHLMSDASSLRATATHVHDVAHVGGNPAHLQADIDVLHAKFQHLEQLVYAIDHSPVVYGQPRCDTRYVRRELQRMHSSIDALAVAVRQVCLPQAYPVRYPTYPPVVPGRPGIPYRADGHHDDHDHGFEPRRPYPGNSYPNSPYSGGGYPGGSYPGSAYPVDPGYGGPSFPQGASRGGTSVRFGNGRFSIRIGG